MKQTNSLKPAKFDRAIIGALAEVFDVHYITIERWVATNDDRLTSEKALNVYRSIAAQRNAAPTKS